MNGKDKSLRNRTSPEEADSLMLMTLLLPATPILELNDIKINDLKNNNTDNIKAFSRLTEARQDEISFLHGVTGTYALNNGSVFVYTR